MNCTTGSFHFAFINQVIKILKIMVLSIDNKVFLLLSFYVKFKKPAQDSFFLTYFVLEWQILCQTHWIKCLIRPLVVILQRVPAFISWIRYMSFNYHTYRLLLKVQYDHAPCSFNVNDIDNGVKEVSAMIAMVFGYRLLAYISLRMKIPHGAWALSWSYYVMNKWRIFYHHLHSTAV